MDKEKESKEPILTGEKRNNHNDNCKWDFDFLQQKKRLYIL